MCVIIIIQPERRVMNDGGGGGGGGAGGAIVVSSERCVGALVVAVPVQSMRDCRGNQEDNATMTDPRIVIVCVSVAISNYTIEQLSENAAAAECSIDCRALTLYRAFFIFYFK